MIFYHFFSNPWAVFALKLAAVFIFFLTAPLVLGYVNYYQGRGRATMETGLRRSGQFMSKTREIFRSVGVPEDIAWLGQVESAWRPTARSWAAASGLWQFIPSTGSRFGLRQTAYIDERNGYEKATVASAHYLKWLHDRYGARMVWIATFVTAIAAARLLLPVDWAALFAAPVRLRYARRGIPGVIKP